MNIAMVTVGLFLLAVVIAVSLASLRQLRRHTEFNHPVTHVSRFHKKGTLGSQRSSVERRRRFVRSIWGLEWTRESIYAKMTLTPEMIKASMSDAKAIMTAEAPEAPADAT